jgi:hypothetical protein
VDFLTIGVIDLQQFLDMGLLLGECEIEDSEVIFVGLNGRRSTSFCRTSLLSNMRASLVLQRVELTTVAE